MQEIWLLQTRFPQRQRKRVMRTLAHPRFRAAFDFLQLRRFASDEHAEDVEFWREAQDDPDNAIAAHPETMTEDGEPAPRKRRRRRRRGTAVAE